MSPDIMTLFPASRDLLGKHVSDLAGEDLRVYADGSVYGTLKHVTEYVEFSSNEEEQSGYYFPFKLTKTGTTMTLRKNGVAAPEKDNMPFDPEIVFRVSKEDTFTVEVDDTLVVTFNFKNVIWT